MRPTDLAFRSPKELTPDPYFPKVAFDGRIIAYSSNASSFPQAQRFRQYDNSKNQNYRVGPGAYDLTNLTIATSKVKNTPVLKFLAFKHSKEPYTMIGNHMIPDEEYKPERRLSAAGFSPDRTMPLVDGSHHRRMSTVDYRPQRRALTSEPKQKDAAQKKTVRSPCRAPDKRQLKSPYLANITCNRRNAKTVCCLLYTSPSPRDS